MCEKQPIASPTPRFRGEISEELVAITVAEIRSARRLERQESIDAADGPVDGRVGDFVIQFGTEHYPIRPEVFYGTYQIMGQVGLRYVGKRLLHERRAWEIVSNTAEYDYVQGGTVAVDRGGWLYRSDDDDFGLINAKAKRRSHIEIGTSRDYDRGKWKERFERAVFWLSLLPPALAFLALVAFAIHDEYPRITQVLLGGESLGLAIGVYAVWRIRKSRWALRAALDAGTEVARDFQGAVQLLGQSPSQSFPSMALWRAAQRDDILHPNLTADGLRKLKEQIYTTQDRINNYVKSYHASESMAERISWVSAVLVLGLILVAMLSHTEIFELLAIWLPSVVGAVNASAWRRQLIRRANVGRDFLSELHFVRVRLLHLAPKDDSVPNGAHEEEALAAIRSLCRATAEYTQHQLWFALAEDPHVPV